MKKEIITFLSGRQYNNYIAENKKEQDWIEKHFPGIDGTDDLEAYVEYEQKIKDTFNINDTIN